MIICALAALMLLGGCGSSDARSSYEAGCEALKNGDYETAVSEFDATISSGKLQAQAYRGEGLVQLYQNNVADACILFEKSLLNADEETDAFRRDVNLYLAYARISHGEQEKAMEIYNSLLAKEEDPEIFFLRGRLNLRMEDTDSAKADFDKAAALSSDYDLFINIFLIYDGLGKSADGARYLERAMDLVSQEEDDFYEQGLISYYLENYQEAKESLIQGIRADADDTDCIFLLGEVYLALNDVPDARAVYQDHLENEETAAYAYNGLAMCDMAESDYQSALEHVQAGLELNREDANKGLIYNEIVIYEYLGDWESAKNLAVQYAASYPTDELAQREYEFLSTR
ncbi:MAG: tetratricopeptide repeat protein [Lachnospiraceae bacterium]|nr:tetratricopeptide repeat protein [Lachnospiraceae bacterium]